MPLQNRVRVTVPAGTLAVYQETLPDGVSVLRLPFDGEWGAFQKAPAALMYDGIVHGRSGYDSDVRVVFYRSDIRVAHTV